MKIKTTIQNCLASCLMMGSFQCATAYAAPAYQVTDLGTLGGARSLGIAINEHGQVTGVAERADGLYHTFLYSNGAMHDLGTLGGGNSWGSAINDLGQVTGSSETLSGASRAFVYQGGQLVDLGSPLGGDSYGQSINNNGQVLFNSNTSDNLSGNTFLYDQGQSNSLVPLPFGNNFISGTAINDNGQITGTYLVQSQFQGFSYDDGALTLFGVSGTGTAINAQGDVAGYAQGQLTPSGYYHYQAALYHNGTYTLLGTIDGLVASQAYGLNDHGWVVGSSSDEVNQDSFRAFLYHDGAMADINDLVDPTSGWTFTAAYDINNQGQITGEGLVGGVAHAFLLTPVPEASSASMMLAGLSLLAVAIRRRRNGIEGAKVELFFARKRR